MDVSLENLPRNEREWTDEDFIRSLAPAGAALRRAHDRMDAGDIPAARESVVEHFRTREGPAWFYDFRDGRRGKPPGVWPRETHYDADELLALADGLLENRFALRPGITLEYGPELDWVDDQTANIGVPGNLFRRCHWMEELALAHAMTRRPAYAEKFAELAARWLADWPLEIDDDFRWGNLFSQRLNFKALPSGVRILNWLTCIYSGVLFAPQVPTDTAFALLKSLLFAGLQYRRFADEPFEVNNRRLMRCATIPAMVGIMFPECPAAVGTLDAARRELAAHARGSILDDGGYCERSAFYTIIALEMMLTPLTLARRNDVRLADRATGRAIRRCCDHVARITMPDGRLPAVGDGTAEREDVARVLRRAEAGLASRTAAAVLDRLGFERPADGRVEPVRRLPRVAWYPQAGYFVARDGWSPDASAMSLVAPDGSNPGAGHDHDDYLSVELVARGRRIVGRPVREMYELLHDPRWRGTPAHKYLYSMGACNVVLVGGRAVRTPEELMEIWQLPIVPVRCDWRRLRDGVRVTASHRAYADTLLTRDVTFRHDAGWTVRDRAAGPARRHVLRWHFERGVEVSPDGETFVASAGGQRVRVALAGDSAGPAELYRDEEWTRPLRESLGCDAPWVLDVPFGGDSDDAIETRFEIVP